MLQQATPETQSVHRATHSLFLKNLKNNILKFQKCQNKIRDVDN
jgi:hypothetical protein